MEEIISNKLQKYEKSYADLTKSKRLLNFDPKITIDEGIRLNIEILRGKHLNE